MPDMLAHRHGLRDGFQTGRQLVVVGRLSELGDLLLDLVNKLTPLLLGGIAVPVRFEDNEEVL